MRHTHTHIYSNVHDTEFILHVRNLHLFISHPQMSSPCASTRICGTRWWIRAFISFYVTFNNSQGVKWIATYSAWRRRRQKVKIKQWNYTCDTLLCVFRFGSFFFSSLFPRCFFCPFIILAFNSRIFVLFSNRRAEKWKTTTTTTPSITYTCTEKMSLNDKTTYITLHKQSICHNRTKSSDWNCL